MMMGPSYAHLIAMICIIFVIAIPASGAPTGKASLDQLIEENKNLKMDVDEMAFLLATHGYDAIPKDSYVVVRVDGENLKVVP